VIEERFLELDGSRTRVLERDGAGAAVVFLHGVTSSASTWKPFLESLPDGLRGVAFDALGHGWTERDGPRRRVTTDDRRGQLVEVLDGLGLDRAWLIAHSMGCGPVLRLAWQQPERVQGLLLSAPAALGRRKLGATIRLARFRPTARLLERIAPLTVPRMARARVKRAAEREPDPDLMEREASHAISRPRETVRGFVDVVGHGDVRRPTVDADRWRRIDAPVWILRGGGDLDWMPEDQEDGYRALLPTVRIERWDEVAHSAHIAAPERFRAHLEHFLRETGALPSPGQAGE
jgi:3-oxoadipate enol-lactonase